MSLAALELAAEPVPLLAGRLSVRVPAGMVSDARGRDVMEAPQPEESETRLLLDVGETRVVLVAWEMARTLPEGDLAQAVRDTLEKEPERRDRLVLHEQRAEDDRLRAVLVEPLVAEAGAVAVPVRLAIVVHPDGLLQQLAVHVNPAGAQDMPGAIELATRILASVRGGSRRCDVGARSLSLTKVRGRTLLLDLPAHSLCRQQDGGDFVVHSVASVVPLGASGAVLDLYEGNAPQGPAESGKLRAAQWWGRDVPWMLSQSPGIQVRYSAEVLLDHPLREPPHPEWDPDSGEPPPPPRWPEFLHIRVSAPSPEERARFMQVASTLQVVELPAAEEK